MIVHPAGSRIAADGAKLRLNAAAAQAIGLAMQALATNAGKYGALSMDTARSMFIGRPTATL
jgi:two-component sensor histidine kinase